MALAVLLAVGGTWIGMTVGSWPRADAPNLRTPELVIALSSWFDHDSAIDAGAEGRLRTAAALASRRHVPRVVTTRIADDRGVTSDYGQRTVLGAANYAGPWSILAPVVRTTREEALALASELPGQHAIVVVTSLLHTRRACAAFEQVGFTVECVSGYVDRRWWPFTYEYLYERAAVVMYRRRGWVR